MHNFSDLFDKKFHMFRTGPLSIIKSISTLYTHIRYLSCQFRWLSLCSACVQLWDTPEDGQWTCPKHVEYFIK